MDEDEDVLIDDLRKKSRTLLDITAKNSEKISKEIKRLCLQNSAYERRCGNKEEQNPYLKSHREIWKLRNDSSAVNNLLCQDHLFKNKKHICKSAPNMRPLEKIVIPSKNLSHTHCTHTVNRKPVKECYCNVELKKIQTRSSRTRHTPAFPCNYNKSHVCHVSSSTKKDMVEDVPPPISCETIRRVQKINYSPKSQFLRNVQKKVSILKNVPFGDCPDTCPRSSYYHKIRSDKATEIDTQSKTVDYTSSKPSTTDLESLWQDRVTDDEERQSEREQVTMGLSKHVEAEEAPRKPSKTKSLMRRTISSKKHIPERRKEKSEKIAKGVEKKKSKTYSVYPEDYGEGYYEGTKWILTREKDDQEKAETFSSKETKESSKEAKESSKEVIELKKFREKNYFETHGSSQTLTSSKSSGSLQQYYLNDRLFPEPWKRIHRKDLVVTMPPCATIQRKRVHYFPRYIVQQEKSISSCNTNYKKKRCQNCPLTGHAIDLGITKTRPVLNSLALKYQKRLP